MDNLGNSLWGRKLQGNLEDFTTAYISFQPTETCAKTPVSPSRSRFVYKNRRQIILLIFLFKISFGSG